MDRILIVWFVFTAVLFCSIEPLAEQTTFRVNDPAGRNVVKFESNAPLETIVGKTGRISGFVRIDPDDLTSMPYAEFDVDADSLDTGILLRNEHMLNQYLETERFPNIRFELKEIETGNAKRLENGKPVDLVGVGIFYLHGVTREIPVELLVQFQKEHEQTRQLIPGNLLKIKARFGINLNDYDIPIPQLVALKLDAQIRISVDVIASDFAEDFKPKDPEIK